MILRKAFTLLFMALSVTVGGNALAVMPDGLKPFPRSRLIQDKTMDAQEYRVMLGGVLKINGLIRTDRELRLNGTLSRMTWQLPVGHTPEDGFRYLRDQLQRWGVELLYECSARQCGASNIWANDLFETARLYGVDESQYYLAARKGVNYMVVYAIRRGNGRVFLHLDWLVDESAGNEGWVETLKQQGYAELPEWPESPENAVQEIVAVLKDNPDSHVVLVLHQEGRDIELSIRESRELALRLRDQVLAEGIAPDRIEAYGAGALSPRVLGGRKQLAVLILMTQE